MTYELITGRDMSVGISAILVYLNDVTGGWFMPAIVLLIYAVLALGSYYAQYRTKGQADAAACFAVAGYVMIPFVVFLGMIPGAINGKTIIEVVVLAAVGTLWLYFSKKPT